MRLTERLTEVVLNLLYWHSLLHSLKKANDDSDFHNCDEYKATFKRSLMNIKYLKDIHQKNLSKILMVHLNINSARQTFNSSIGITIKNIDILMI